jgi:hypothetical protein
VIGDPIAQVRRRFVRHSNDVIQRHWDRLGGPTATHRGPHISAPARTTTGRALAS